ncbi:MAG TPA: hypothetical protein VH163_08085 [Gemmatimonadales bacterium]|jgi:hypothetical protein|nr:hypothetical protein [Gemmatimonadales bacterium]
MTDDIRDEDLNDQELVRAARQLGVQAAGQLDLERTARGVVARWRAEQRRTITPLWRSPAMIRVAAAIILLVAGLETWEHRHRLPTQEVVAVEATDVGLEGLSAEQLAAILPGVDQAEDVETTASDAGLEGLSVDELKSVLNQMGS